MNPFDYLIEDIFNSSDFVDFCYINNRKTKCIASEITNDASYTAFGIDEGISLFLRLKVSDYKPDKTDKITYKNHLYKVDNFILDSAAKTYNVYLKSLSSK